MRASLASIAIMLGACGSGPKDAPTFAEQFITAWSSRVGECTSIPADVVQTLFAPTDYKDHVSNSVAKKRLTYDSAQAAACLTALPKESCTTVGINPLAAPDHPCVKALRGTLKLGSTCFDEELDECETGSTCDHANNCGGTCQLTIALGGPCTATSDCAGLLECVRGVCRERVVESGGCGGSDGGDCALGFYCDTPIGGSPGICRPRQVSGACDQTQAGQCALGYTCAAAVGTTGSSCEKSLGEGASCTAGLNQCAFGLSCINGACARWGGAGSECGIVAGEPVDCLNAWCGASVSGPSGTGTCQALFDDGAMCASSQQCSSFQCGTAGSCVALCPLPQ